VNRREAVLALIALGLTPASAVAQHVKKVWRIGILETVSMMQNTANLDGFLEGMRQLGYIEGRDFVIEYRSADGRAERFPDLTAELIRGKIDLIVTRGTPATLIAKKATSTIPVITTAIGEPLVVVPSLARPGGNITGLSSVTTDLSGKRLELLREIVPGVTKFAVLMNMSNAALPLQWKETESAAKAMRVQVQLFDVRRSEDIDRAFDVAAKQRINAVVVGQDGLIQTEGKRIVELVAKNRLPAMYSSSEYVEYGGLISYGVNYPDLYRRTASYVSKVIKGAKPGDLPIEQPTKFDLMINRNTAKLLGIAVPQTMLVRADRVIE
jgi:putative ABC transport system substrate-binding protein